MEKKHSISNKIIIIICAINITAIMLYFIYGFYSNIITAINLSNNGISTKAKILEYKPDVEYLYFSKSWHYAYLISYDKHKEIIELQSDKYQINNGIPVVYDENNPKLVWLSGWLDKNDMNAWDLYCLNTSFRRKYIWLLFYMLISFKMGYRALETSLK